MSKLAGLGSLLLVGCASVGRLPAPMLGETSAILEPGHVAITGAGGAGTDLDRNGVGAGGRVRMGIGHQQEVRVEAAAIGFDSVSDHCFFDCEPGDIKHFREHAESALLSWKIQLPPTAALIIGAGASRHRWAGGDANPPEDTDGRSLDATIGLLGSRSFTGARWLTLYGGPRLAAGVPIGADVTGHAHTIFDLSWTVGAESTLSERWAFFLEGGVGLAWIVDQDPTMGFRSVAGVTLRL